MRKGEYFGRDSSRQQLQRSIPTVSVRGPGRKGEKVTVEGRGFCIDAVLNGEPVEVLVHGDNVVCLYHQSQTWQHVLTSLEIQ